MAITSQPRFSVIIPAYNAQATLSACLSALETQTIPHSTYEVIVVDDGSTDNTAAIAREHGAIVISQANQGPSAARNLGMGHARAEIILFTDADCIPEPHWIEAITAPICQNNIVAVKGSYTCYQREIVARFIQQEYMDRYDRLNQRQYIDHIDTGSAAYHRGTLLDMGGFDENYTDPSVEDQELSFRLAKAGYKMVFAPKGQVAHRHPATVRGYARRKFILGYWKVREFSKHPDKFVSDTYTPQTLKLQVILAPIVLLTFSPFLLLGLVATLIFAISALPFLLKVSRRDPAILPAVLPLLMVRALSGGAGMALGLVQRASG